MNKIQTVKITHLGCGASDPLTLTCFDNTEELCCFAKPTVLVDLVKFALLVRFWKSLSGESIVSDFLGSCNWAQ
jgi:hypothetical protein